MRPELVEVVVIEDHRLVKLVLILLARLVLLFKNFLVSSDACVSTLLYFKHNILIRVQALCKLRVATHLPT